MSKVLPILFNIDMVRAILDGRKTVTRRIVKPQPKMRLCYVFAGYGHGKWEYPGNDAWEYWGEEFRRPDNIEDDELKRVWTPSCHTDDILYVRETWQHLYELDGNEQIIEDTGKYYYAASDTLPFDTYVDSMGVTHENIPWRPSIHMPKEAARIFLRVTDVRVERLQDITDEEAKAEGANFRNGKNVGWEEKMRRTAVERFAEIWDATIPKKDLDKYSWDANPWVWVIKFERCEKPEGWCK